MVVPFVATGAPRLRHDPGLMSALCGLLYVILNAEDHVVLIGSGILFSALAATMYVTHRINWHVLTVMTAG